MLKRFVRHIKYRRARWESICTRCGRCCYHRKRVSGEVVIDHARPCAYLDTETGVCTIYDRRFELNPDCHKVTILHAKFDPLMPSSCAYVRAYRRKR